MAKVVDLYKYRARIIDKTINNYLEVFGAVCIEGPKWCGKLWTSSYHSNSEYLVGDWCAFEIKLGANQIDKAAKSLIELKNDMIAKGDKSPKVLCVICGLTNVAYQREDGVFVVPITALKN